MRHRPPVKGERFKKLVTLAVKQASDADRTIEHVITARSVDRDGDVIEPRGVRLEHFRQNPVVFFGHESWAFPVARSLALDVSDQEIVALTQFAGLNQAYGEAETAYRLARDGFLRAWSIGFDPITWSEDHALPDQDGWWFKECELYEYSLVGIPSNPLALSRMVKGYGLPTGATERDLADAIRKDRHVYWDVAQSLTRAPGVPSCCCADQRHATSVPQDERAAPPAPPIASPLSQTRAVDVRPTVEAALLAAFGIERQKEDRP